MNAFGFLFACLVAALLLAVLVIAGLLAVADQLREFAARVPHLAAHSVLLLDGLVFVVGVVFLAVLTFVYS